MGILSALGKGAKSVKTVAKAKELKDTGTYAKDIAKGVPSKKARKGVKPGLGEGTDATLKKRADNVTKVNVKKAKAKQAYKQREAVKGKVKNSTDNLKGRKAK